VDGPEAESSSISNTSSIIFNTNDEREVICEDRSSTVSSPARKSRPRRPPEELIEAAAPAKGLVMGKEASQLPPSLLVILLTCWNGAREAKVLTILEGEDEMEACSWPFSSSETGSTSPSCNVASSAPRFSLLPVVGGSRGWLLFIVLLTSVLETSQIVHCLLDGDEKPQVMFYVSDDELIISSPRPRQ
jgi:hypothetical protein